MAAPHQAQSDWQHSLFDCTPMESCFLGFCCPCILFGRTSERIRDPSMQAYDMFNQDCMIFAGINVSTGLGWIYAMLKRGEIRERFGIEGSGLTDCCTTYWCCCCAIIQHDNEVKKRLDPAAAPVATGYQPTPGMQMPGAPPPVRH